MSVTTFNSFTLLLKGENQTKRMQFTKQQVFGFLDSPKGTDFDKSIKGKQTWKKLNDEQKIQAHARAFANDAKVTKWDIQYNQ